MDSLTKSAEGTLCEFYDSSWGYLKSEFDLVLAEYQRPDNFISCPMRRPQEKEWREKRGHNHQYKPRPESVNHNYLEDSLFPVLDAIGWVFGEAPLRVETKLEMRLDHKRKTESGYYQSEEYRRRLHKQKVIQKKIHNEMWGLS